MTTTTIKPFPRRLSGPAIEPVTLAETMVHLRETSDSGGPIDQTVTRLITAAREACEQLTERTLITTAWRLRLDAFPVGGAIELLQPPIIAVGSVAYLDADGVSRLSNPADYVTDTASEPGWLVPAPGKTWPTTQAGAINAVTIDFTAGYGPAAANVPSPLREWILCAIEYMYDHRGEPLPENFGAGLIRPYRLLGL
jgi:uncharacterized phiE125 gp8 family phage protein